MPKILRSFLGAGLGAFVSIFLAATFNNPWLLFAGAGLGWLAGYHGDRLLVGFRTGLDEARSAGLGSWHLAARLWGCVPGGTVSLSILSSAIGRIGWVAGWMTTGVWWTICALGSLLRSLVLGIVSIPAAFRRWLGADPTHPARAIQFAVSLGWMALIGVLSWHLITPALDPIGSTVRSGYRPHVVTTFEYYTGMTIFTGLLTLVGWAPGLLARMTNRRPLWSWALRGKLETLGVARFILREIGLTVLYQVYALVMVAGTITFGIVAFCISILAIITVGLGAGTIYGTWRAVRADRDYGVVSLVVALLAGTGTFLLLREQLVADPTYRLAVSAAVGLGAGAVSACFTWVGSMAFREGRPLQRIASANDPAMGCFERIWSAFGLLTTRSWRGSLPLLPA